MVEALRKYKKKSEDRIKKSTDRMKKAFDSGLLPNSLEDERYFNIKRMQSLCLQ